MPSSSKKIESIAVRIDLKNQYLKHFQSLRKKIAKDQNKPIENVQKTNVIKKALKHYDNTYGNDFFVVESEVAWKLKQILKSPSFQIKYPFSTVQELFKYYSTQLICEWEKNRKNLRENLYEILTTLNPAYREIAVICSNLSQNKTEITLTRIKETSQLDDETIIEGLNALVADGYINKIEIEGEIKFWVQ